MNKKIILIIGITIVFTSVIMLPIGAVFAEQIGDSPESGVVSRIKAIYDSLTTLGHGSDSAGSWGDWGSMWNRIRSAGEWVPDGTATSEDVLTGETFYGSSRTLITGTASPAVNWRAFSKVVWDDRRNDSSADGDNAGEEAVWVNTSGSADTGVWRDSRTGLYWSANQGSMTNDFTVASCDFYTADPRGSYSGADSDCGNAVNTCATLSLDADGDAVPETDWYMPTQKEALLGYIDGMYNNTSQTFTVGGVGTSYFWTSTQLSPSSSQAWRTNYDYGAADYPVKTDLYKVRCVRSD